MRRERHGSEQRPPALNLRDLGTGTSTSQESPPPPPPPRTKWTRRVPHPVLIGHAASLTGRASNRGACVPTTRFERIHRTDDVSAMDPMS